MLLRGEMDENGHFSRLISCADFNVVVVKKRFLGHPKKFKKSTKSLFPLLKFSRTHQNLFLSADLRGTFSNF